MTEPARMRTRRVATFLAGLLSAIFLAACGDEGGDPTEAEEPAFDDVELVGSELVAALARTAGERFQLETEVDVQVVPATTEAAFDAVCTRDAAVAMTDRRPSDAELAGCDGEGVELVELMAGYHAVGVTVNPGLGVDCLTAAELRRLWREGSPVDTYSELRPSFPDTVASLYGPDSGSPSLTLFTDEVVGRPGAIREDYEPVVDRRVFITRLARDRGASGFFNFAEIDSAAPEDLRLVAVAADDGCVAPSFESVRSGEYDLLSRPLYMYVARAALDEPEVSRYMQFLFENYEQTADASTTLVPLAPAQVEEALAKLPEDPPAPE